MPYASNVPIREKTHSGVFPAGAGENAARGIDMKNSRTDFVYRYAMNFIEERRFSNESKMPSENALSLRLSVSRDTVRAAYERLTAEGYLVRVQGSGTYIRKDKAVEFSRTEGRTGGRIGLILQGKTISPSEAMIDGIKSVFERSHKKLFVYLTDNRFFNERKFLQTLDERSFDGLIVDGVKSGMIEANLDCYRRLWERKKCVIFYNNYYRDLHFPRVTVNNSLASRYLVNELIRAGHRRVIGIFLYDNVQSTQKFQGMLDALRSHGAEFTDDQVLWLSSDEVNTKKAMHDIASFIRRSRGYTALVCVNERICRIAVNIIREMGMRIPDDLSLVCYDFAGTDYENTGITCTLHRGRDLGVHLASQLSSMIRDESIDENKYSYVMSPILYRGNSIRGL